MPDIVTPEHYKLAGVFKNMLSVYREAEDLINIGAYKQGANPEIDDAIKLYPSIKTFLKQDMNEHFTFQDILKQMEDIVKQLET